MANQISIQEVIARLRSDHDAGGQSCSLTIVRSSGKLKGRIQVLSQVRYGAPRQQQPGAGGSSNGLRQSTDPHGHIDRGTLPITDLSDRGRYKTPLISHIIGYNQYQVRH